MVYWLLFTLLGVFIVKYYTAVEMRKLERRLERVKDDLHQVKDKLSSAQERTEEARSEEESHSERVRRMKETIEDLEVRLTSSGDSADEENVMVSDSAPPVRF